MQSVPKQKYDWISAVFYGGLAGCLLIFVWFYLTDVLLGDWLFGTGAKNSNRIVIQQCVALIGIPVGFVLGAWLSEVLKV